MTAVRSGMRLARACFDLRSIVPVALLLFSASSATVSRADGTCATTLSVQGCNTRCQSEQTDCVLRCDGDTPCIQQCQKVADTCVDQCVKP